MRPGERKDASIGDRLMRFTDKNGPLIVETACWTWTGAKRGGGYGTLGFSHLGKKWHEYAHRLSWKEFRGPIPEGICLCHRCDNTTCINPDHLFLGTHDENMKDRTAKGRSKAKGPLKNKAEIIERIKTGASAHSISRETGVHRVTVSKIKQRLAELDEVWPEYKPTGTDKP